SRFAFTASGRRRLRRSVVACAESRAAPSSSTFLAALRVLRAACEPFCHCCLTLLTCSPATRSIETSRLVSCWPAVANAGSVEWMFVKLGPIALLHKFSGMLFAVMKPLGIWGVGGLALIDSALIPIPVSMDGVVIGYVATNPHRFFIYCLIAA